MLKDVCATNEIHKSLTIYEDFFIQVEVLSTALRSTLSPKVQVGYSSKNLISLGMNATELLLKKN